MNDMIEPGRKVRCLTNDGFVDDCYWVATSQRANETVEFPTYSAAAWWLRLINEAAESRERRLGIVVQ